MSNLNQLPAPALLLPVDATAAAPAIQIGGGVTGSSGTGIYGDAANVKISVGGVLKATINSTGIVGAITGTASLATSLTGGSGGTIPYQSAASVTAMLANGSVGQVLASQGTTVAPHWVTPTPVPTILALSSAATMGSSATEAVAVTGLLTTDTILAVSQVTPGGNSLPLLGYSTVINGGLTVIFSADPGAGAVVVVSVKR